MTHSNTNPIGSLINQRWNNENKDFKIEISPGKISLIVHVQLSDDYFHVLGCISAFSEKGTLIIYDTTVLPEHNEWYINGTRTFETAFGDHVTTMTFTEWFLAAQNRLLEYYDLQKQDWNKITQKAKEHVIVTVNFGSGTPTTILKSWKDKVSKHPEKYPFDFKTDFDKLYDFIKNEDPESIEHMPLSYETIKQAWQYFKT